MAGPGNSDWLAAVWGTAEATREAQRSLYEVELQSALLPGACRQALAAARPVTIPEEALRPWPVLPPQEASDAEPARWAVLRAQRDPQPPLFEGLDGMASWHRALGWRVEQALRDGKGDAWWYDPELPLALIMSGLPRWGRDGSRGDTGEDCEGFAQLVREYEKAIAAGSVFPPLLVTAKEPVADRAALGWRRYAAFSSGGWSSSLNHYSVINGRHRTIAAWRCGLRTFPAFVLGPVRELAAANDVYGNHWSVPAADVASEAGRRGEDLEVLQKLGKLKVILPQEPAP